MKLTELQISNKKVLIRVDFNVPLNDQLEITDDTRIQKALPTLRYILEQNASLIIMTHMGRPKDNEESRRKLTTKNLVKHLAKLLNRQIDHISTFNEDELIERASNLEPGDVILLENTRFESGEKKGNVEFAKKLSQLGDIYVNDAFGTAHRAHASTSIIAQFFGKDEKAFGFLMNNELENANRLLNKAEKPVTAIIGGAKVSDKIQLIERLMDFADDIIIGGGMAYTIIKSQGGKIGNSLCEDDFIELAQKLLKQAKETNTNIHLPVDSIVTTEFSNSAEVKETNSHEIEEGWMGLDIGNQARKDFAEVILKSKSILWNGPVGVFEMSNFDKGTIAIAESVAEATQNGAFSLIGGGDSVAAINKVGLADKVSFISTGGGAMLEFLEGKELPGVIAIQ